MAHLSKPSSGRIARGIFLLPFLLATPAQAQVCVPEKTFNEQLLKIYDEEPIVAGITKNGRLWEFYANRTSLTWTVVMRDDGTVCIFAHGKDWTEFVPPLPEASHGR